MAQDGTDLIPEPSGEDHVRGSLEAPVVITEFGDYECPYCGLAYGVLEAIRKAYGARVALVFRHLPLPMHPHALAATQAAEAAGSIGKFWEMHDQLYRHQQALTERDLLKYADAIGVARELVQDAIERYVYRARIERDVSSSRESGVQGTPGLFINGFSYDDEVSVAALSETIDRALAAGGGG
jgi:protein-disulfide isomerase